MTFRKQTPQPKQDPIQEFRDFFGVMPAEASRAFQDPNHPLLVILRHVRVQALEALVQERDLVPHGYRQQGIVQAIDDILSIPDTLKELS